MSIIGKISIQHVYTYTQTQTLFNIAVGRPDVYPQKAYFELLKDMRDLMHS
jgi:hypothetical protein